MKLRDVDLTDEALNTITCVRRVPEAGDSARTEKLQPMTYRERLQALFLNRINLNVEGKETVSFGNKGASVYEIESLGRDIICLIPDDYTEFLKSWNGCTLFDLNQQAGCVFFGTDEIENETNRFKEIYGDTWDTSIILFCSVTGSGDFIGFRVTSNGYEIIDCCHDDDPKYWRVIYNSFSDFVNQIITTKGATFWLD